MKALKILKFSLCCITPLIVTQLQAQTDDYILRFKQPAKNFTSSSVLGNGRIGAMVFGDTAHERIALNEISLWSGGPQDADMKDAHQYLTQIQNLLLKRENRQAQQLLEKHFIANGAGSGSGNGANVKYGCYQTFGDLKINWHDSTSLVTGYTRQLDLLNATSITSFARSEGRISEEVFADYLNDILWVRLSSSNPSGLHADISLFREEHAQVRVEGNRLIMQGQLPAGKEQGMQFAAAAEASGATLLNYKGTPIFRLNGQKECIIKISMATNYDAKTHALGNINPLITAISYLAKSRQQNFNDAKKGSTLAFQKFFNRCNLHFPENPDIKGLSTAERLERYNKGMSDPQLPALYFNFGRYLLIASSRPGLMPANLQGLWATEYQTPWNGDYHLNINLQMNYWPAEVCNLSDLTEPLNRFTTALTAPGQKTARAYYGCNDGWVAHVITNPWLFTSPGEGAGWGSTLTGGAWLCEHIWEHYRFTGDKKFLAQYYPVLKGAAKFLQSILIREPEHGWLVTAPSNSPENAYVMPNRFEGNTCMGPTMDMQICRELFNACIEAAAALHTDDAWSKELKNITRQLAPNQIGKAGDLNEWVDDWQDAEPHHRHVSHLYGLYPYDEITPWDTPDLTQAALKTLETRGDESTGWSKAWKVNFWARLGNGDRALSLLKGLLRPVTATGTNMSHGGGSYSNLFCAPPPFQIDGNFGGTAGIAEMLLQSHGKNQIIRMLPALPADKDWQQGSISGLKARNNFEINMIWKSGKLENAEIKSIAGKPCHLLLPAGMKVQTSAGKVIAKAAKTARIITFNTSANNAYRVL